MSATSMRTTAGALLVIALFTGCRRTSDAGTGEQPGGTGGTAPVGGGAGNGGAGPSPVAGASGGGMTGGGGVTGEAGASGGTGMIADGGPAGGGGSTLPGGSPDGGGAPPPPPPPPPPPADAGAPVDLPRGNLDTDPGCPGVFNPDQLLDLRFELAAADWAALLADLTYERVFPARFRCNDGPELVVGIRRKRSGGLQKVGLKVDINHVVDKARFYGLKKLSLENGVSSGTNADSGDVTALMREYLAWRLMVRSGAISGRAAMVRVTVNGAALGVYVNVEQVDKTFLESRLNDDTGWLYKKSGGDDGFRTHELDMLDDPFDDYFCFFGKGGRGCTMPTAAELARDLPAKLNIPQLLRLGAANAIMANTDAPLFKDNNYYWYDWTGGPRVYLPWDLDSTMGADLHVLTGGVGGQVSFYTNVLFSNWAADYRAIVQELVTQKLTLPVIASELERVQRVAGLALDADPHAAGTTADALQAITTWWQARLPAVQMQLGQ